MLTTEKSYVIPSNGTVFDIGVQALAFYREYDSILALFNKKIRYIRFNLVPFFSSHAHIFTNVIDIEPFINTGDIKLIWPFEIEKIDSIINKSGAECIFHLSNDYILLLESKFYPITETLFILKLIKEETERESFHVISGDLVDNILDSVFLIDPTTD